MYVVVPAMAVEIAAFQVPVTPSRDVVGRTGAAEPTQSAAIGVNVGVMFGFTVTLMVDVVAHWPAVGVKVYVVAPAVAVEIAAFQVPVTPSSDVVGSTGAAEPTQSAAIGVNVGVMFGFTVTESVVVVAHWPAVGVKVYVVVPAAAVEIAAFQVPVTPSRDVVGSTGAAEPTQSAAIGVNVGVMFGFTVTLKVAVVAH